MLDARRIGAYLAGLRREKDLTQVEVAERLNISHQAVSKWERGESLPDIGMLPAIARLFGVTVDELLRAGEHPAEPDHASLTGRAAADRAAAERSSEHTNPLERTERADRPDHGGLGEMAIPGLGSVAASAEQGVMTEDAGIGPGSAGTGGTELSAGTGIPRQGDSGAGHDINWETITRLAPFLGRDALDQLAEAAAAGGVDWGVIASLAPFLHQDTLARLVERATGEELDIGKLMTIAPFLGRDHVDRLVNAAVIGDLDWNVVTALAPFVHRDTLAGLVERAASGEINPDRLLSLAPFLGKDSLERLLLSSDLSRLDANMLAAFAPFLDQQALDKLVRELFRPPH